MKGLQVLQCIKYECEHPQIKAGSQPFNLIVSIQIQCAEVLSQTKINFSESTGLPDTWPLVCKCDSIWYMSTLSWQDKRFFPSLWSLFVKPMESWESARSHSNQSPHRWFHWLVLPLWLKVCLSVKSLAEDDSLASCCSPGWHCFRVRTQLAVLIKNTLLWTRKLLHLDQTNTLHLIVLLLFSLQLFLCLFLLANTDTESSVLSVKLMLTGQISRSYFLLFLWFRLRPYLLTRILGVLFGVTIKMYRRVKDICAFVPCMQHFICIMDNVRGALIYKITDSVG